MFDVSNGLPEMIGLELARRVRARRLLRNLCVDDLAAQIGVSGKTLGTFERTGRGKLDTFVRVLLAFDLTPGLMGVLELPALTNEREAPYPDTVSRKRAYRKAARRI